MPSGAGKRSLEDRVRQAIKLAILICDEFEVPSGNPYAAEHFNKKTQRWEAYLDKLPKPPKVTIGRGATEHLDRTPVEMGETLSIEEEQELIIALFERNYLPDTRAAVPWFDEAEPQVMAMMLSLAWNAGSGVMNDPVDYPATLAAFNSRDPEAIARQIMWINKSGGERYEGLGARRFCEGRAALSGKAWYGRDEGFKGALRAWRASDECVREMRRVEIDV